MTNRIVVGNLKMKMFKKDIAEYINIIDKYAFGKNIVICPTSLYIPFFDNKSYSIGMQNICHQNIGNFTGEIAANQAISMGVKYVIIGHSERRNNFNETDEIINQKVIEAINSGLNVILCIGETYDDKINHNTFEVLNKQLIKALKGVPESKLDTILVAYEPVWAIGTNVTASTLEIQSIIEYIKSLSTDFRHLKFLYGGSVNESNIYSLIEVKDLDGFLIGDVATDPHKFAKIIEVVVNQ